MKALYYECYSGISGDMNLGALIDIGVPKEYLLNELTKLNLNEFFEIEIINDNKNGIYGTKVTVNEIHHQHHHSHRSFKTIKKIVEDSTLSSNVKEKSIEMFWSLANTEAKIHNKTPEEIHFHEVGAIDSIVDIVGSAICLDKLNIKTILCSKVELGGGFVKCAHGEIPVPAPATLDLLSKIPVTLGRVDAETTTPTGAVILSCNVSKFIDKPSFKIEKIAYGIGQKDFSIPNILRVYLVDLEEKFIEEEEIVIETNIDDMNPEILAFVEEKLFAIGVKDVFTTMISTKKNRFGIKLSVLVSIDKEREATSLIFDETTAIGLRTYVVKKKFLNRKFEKVNTKYGDIPIKHSYDAKRKKLKPEFDDCKIAALKHDIPIQKVYDEVWLNINRGNHENL